MEHQADRRALLEHLRKVRLPPDGGERARDDARRIAGYLRQQGARRIVGFGSAFVADRQFTRRSDLDIAVEGLPADRFFHFLARAQALTDIQLDLVPLEIATEPVRQAVREEGVPL